MPRSRLPPPLPVDIERSPTRDGKEGQAGTLPIMSNGQSGLRSRSHAHGTQNGAERSSAPVVVSNGNRTHLPSPRHSKDNHESHLTTQNANTVLAAKYAETLRLAEADRSPPLLSRLALLCFVALLSFYALRGRAQVSGWKMINERNLALGTATHPDPNGWVGWMDLLGPFRNLAHIRLASSTDFAGQDDEEALRGLDWAAGTQDFWSEDD
ncbi:hypothetical protein IE81DRAFT_321105 [Ceraceosorus guamensis]|uniref:Uncharacterized protein n=1 Tax=Ceraceosorus guamensis TaxID=1522189 RepID=A0A316W3M1_9BASI|nr:hypothetical protein IE81DRAFT_321105 [Ceraceosorus guamensis]PWN44497.1 hypothetical protein IE81DRAFT_321105 [Ceraceosorus guamensis]